jgi:Holliday junction resolvase
MPETKSEKSITNSVIRLLKSEGFWTLKVHGGPMQRAGLPDILAIKGGEAWWLEVKRPGKHPTELQIRRLQQLEDAGSVVGVVHSVAEARQMLTERD